MTQVQVSLLLMSVALMIMLLGYNLPKNRTFFLSIGFFTMLSAAFANYSNWLPQVRGEVPPVDTDIPVVTMTMEQLAEKGEVLIFGSVVGGSPKDSDVGKGQCALCHTVTGNVVRDRAPSLKGIAKRAAERIKETRYLKPDTVQTETYPGSGRATTAEEYIAESHICPNCYVVEGFGVKGTNDRESPMPPVHKSFQLSIGELIAVDTYLFTMDGEIPPSPTEIRTAYEKFIPPEERKLEPITTSTQPLTPTVTPIALATDTPEQIITKMGCMTCHQIPTIAAAKFGPIGPLLVEKANAVRRLVSPEYRAMVKAGKAHAKTPKEYVMESIVNPNAFIAHNFVQKTNPNTSDMIQDFAAKFTVGALDKLADFLLTLDCDAARKDGLKGPRMEPIDQICSRKESERTAFLAK